MEQVFDRLVLGVDPGLGSVGLAVVAGGPRPIVAWARTVRTDPGLEVSERLRLIHRAVAEAIAERAPDVMALERLMWGRNAPSGMDVARASGVALLAAGQAGIEVQEYAPLEVKMAVTGVGNATKQAVRRALSRVLGVEGVPGDPDAADAVAVAVCHLQQAGLRRAARRAW